jgi:spore germination protein GerM
MKRRGLQIGVLLLTLGLLAWGVTIALERLGAPVPEAAPAATPPPSSTAHITATLFYGSPDGQALLPVRREVPLAEGVVAQGRQILVSQLATAPAGQQSVIPAGTELRAFYVTDRGDAFVDLSNRVSTAHPGGSMTELLTVYAIVNAVTANLPAIQRVQILVEGQEVDTIAGHVDVRRPLTRDTSLVREGGP